MHKLYVYGLLLLLLAAGQIYAEETRTTESPKREAAATKLDAKAEAEIKMEMDELEKVMQSAYDHSETVTELGDATGD